MNEGTDAQARKEKGNGADSRVTLTLSPNGNGARGRALSASVVLGPLDEQQQTRFDAEVQMLLAHLVRQQIQSRRPANAEQ